MRLCVIYPIPLSMVLTHQGTVWDVGAYGAHIERLEGPDVGRGGEVVGGPVPQGAQQLQLPARVGYRLG